MEMTKIMTARISVSRTNMDHHILLVSVVMLVSMEGHNDGFMKEHGASTDAKSEGATA